MISKLPIHLLFLLFFALNLSAQELTLKLSQHPNKKAVIVAVHGIRKDTLGTVQLDQNGTGTLFYKTKQAQTGLMNLTIKDKDYLSYDFVLSPTENPTLICDMEYVYTQNTQILNSVENNCLNRWFDHLAQYKQKIGLNQELSKLYKPEEPFLQQLEIEKKITQEQLQKLTDTINKSSLFAARYMQFKLAQEEKLAKVWESNEQRSIAKNYFIQIDFDALYGSSMWFTIINSCIEAYVKEGSFYETFGSDLVENLKRIKNQQVYEDLIDAAISVTEKFAWNKDQEVLVDFIVKHNRINNPKGKLQKIIQSFNLSIGKKAPNLVLTKVSGKAANAANQQLLKSNNFAQGKMQKTLLVFYQSGCSPCEVLLAQLPSKYTDLKNKGIDIIAISADETKEIFEQTSKNFPWSRTYCDFEGINGTNWKNYAVIGTPTLFLVDANGTIISKLSSMEQLDEMLSN